MTAQRRPPAARCAPRGAPRKKPPEAGPEHRGSAAVFARIYRVVRQVPRGQVATYGQIALIAGAPTPRIVGFAMAGLPNGSKVPWQRIINSQGQVSVRKEGGSDWQQRHRLEAEGVRFDRKDRVDFAATAWPGPTLHWLEKNGFDIEEIALRSQRKRRTGAWCRWRF
jgi:methylated-DNA-protein-cysteine methyltransferase-like protein